LIIVAQPTRSLINTDGPLMVETQQDLRENDLGDLAYAPLHEEQDRVAGMAVLTIEVLGAAQERDVDGKKQPSIGVTSFEWP
jgi:hypothetical protein